VGSAEPMSCPDRPRGQPESCYGRNVPVDRRKRGIIGKDIMAVGILDLHANVLPDFTAMAPCLKSWLSSRIAWPAKPGLCILYGSDRCANRPRDRRSSDKLQSLRPLRREIAFPWALVVDENNVEQVQIQPVEHGVECRIAAANMPCVSIGSIAAKALNPGQ